MNWDSPLAVAVVRALLSALIAAAVAYFGALMQGHTSMQALIAAGYMASTTLALRAGVEGLIDQTRSPNNGAVK